MERMRRTWTEDMVATAVVIIAAMVLLLVCGCATVSQQSILGTMSVTEEPKAVIIRAGAVDWEEAGLPATLAGIAASLSLTAVDPVVAITKLSIDGGRDMLGIVRPAKTGSTEIIIPSTIVKQLQVADGGTNRDGTRFVNVNVTMYKPSEKVAEGQEEPGELPPLPTPAPGE